jgi:hypothetical protein
MARNLYRFYLYTVYVILLNFVAATTGGFLSGLLRYTPLNSSSSSVPSQSELVQSTVYVVVTWIIAGGLAGLHGRLIWLDRRSDPAVANNAIRSFFLNVTELLAMLVIIPIIGFVLYYKAIGTTFDMNSLLAYALSFFGMVVLLEWERRQARATTGGAIFWQRFHFYGAQLVLLGVLAWSWFNVRYLLMDLLGLRTLACTSNYPCFNYDPFLFILFILWFTGAWLLYALATSRDTSRAARLVFHGLGLAYGVFWALEGLYQAFRLALSPLFHETVAVKDVFGSGATYDVVSPLLMGLLIIGVYYWLYRDAVRRTMLEAALARLIEVTIVAILVACAFWSGCAIVLYSAFQQFGLVPTYNLSWVSALALLLTGVAYIPLTLYLWRSSLKQPEVALGPRRGFVLFLLGAGILAVAIGGATSLYAWGTAALGSPLSSWQELAYSGLSVFLAGAALVAIYLTTLLREHLLQRPKPAPAEQPPTEALAPTEKLGQLTTIESILDELLAGHISREQAASRIRELSQK